jgi:two-component system response regulator ChvI
MSRAYWNDSDMGLTKGEYRIVHLLVSNVGRWVTYRAIYDCMHYDGFIAGGGDDGYRGNVRSAIKRIRNKFRDLDPDLPKSRTIPPSDTAGGKPAGAD